MRDTKHQQLLSKLLEMVSVHKKDLFSQIIKNRSRHLTVVMEDIFQSQNASAVLRSADCFGIQDVHIIENRNEYTLNPQVSLGSSKWLSLYKYNSEKNNTQEAYENLRKKGYQIVATTPHLNDVSLNELDISKKTALVFGTEMQGLSTYAIENADIHMKIPMYGFTESFNISVSAALCMHFLSEKMRNSNENDWQLSDSEQNEILLSWAKSVVKSSNEIERKILGI